MREREKYEKRLGSVVDGRWRIDALLGWGATSAVYAATHRNGHRAALKVLHLALCAEPSRTERFLREAGIANAIKHRAVVPIRDDGMTEDGSVYLVLELLEGETLEERRVRMDGRLAIEDFAEVVEELMSAVAAVHAAGIVHRDLKPQNVFLTKRGVLKLLDFGTARIFDRNPGSPISLQGLVIGTPAFMSPEQARGARDEVDAQSDVWSLGAMIFTLLSGEHVHSCRDPHAQLLTAASKPARALSSVANAVDGRIGLVIDRALAFDKADRWPDVQTMRIAFRTAVVTAMPTMRDLKVFDDVMADETETALGTLSMSGPMRVTYPPAARASLHEASSTLAETSARRSSKPSEGAPPVSSTSRRHPSKGVPPLALAIGLLAMAVAIVLIGFSLAGSEPPPRAAAEHDLSPPASASAAPTGPSEAPSFIVISAPEDTAGTRAASGHGMARAAKAIPVSSVRAPSPSVPASVPTLPSPAPHAESAPLGLASVVEPTVGTLANDGSASESPAGSGTK